MEIWTVTRYRFEADSGEPHTLDLIEKLDPSKPTPDYFWAVDGGPERGPGRMLDGFRALERQYGPGRWHSPVSAAPRHPEIEGLLSVFKEH